jgi:hypothetical protein
MTETDIDALIELAHDARAPFMIAALISLRDKLVAAEQKNREMALQSIADEGQYIDNYDARLKAEAQRDSALDRVRVLEGVVEWCRPRLSRREYRDTLDKYIREKPQADHTPVVQSALGDKP